MANIGNLAVVLSLDAIQFVQGMDSAGKSAGGFASGLSATFAGLSAVQATGGAVLGTMEGLYAGLKSGLEEIVESGRKARELGTDLNTLAGLNLMAGSDAERFDESLVRLNRSLEEAAMGSGEAAGKFRMLGLDAQGLLDMSLDKRVGAIADKLNSLGSSDRAFAAFELFGREGASILADLEKGSAGVAAAMDKIKAHGGAGITEADVAKAREAQQSLTEMESSFNRIKLVLISEFAPVVKNVADWIADIAGPSGGKLRDSFHNAAVQLTTGLNQAVDQLADAVVYVHRMELGWEKINKIVSAGNPAYWFTKLDAGTIAPKDAFEEEVEKNRKAAHDKLKATLDDLNKPPDLKPQAAAAPVLNQLAGSIFALEVKLRDQVAAFGMAGDAAERFALAHKGATDAQLAHVDAYLREQRAMRDLTIETSAGANVFQQFDAAVSKLDHLKDLGVVVDGYNAKLKDLQDTLARKVDSETLKTIQDAASPLDKFKASLDDLDHLLALHKINAQQYAAAVAKDFDAVGALSQKIEHPGAALEGSVQDYQVRLHDEDRGRAGDVQQQVKATLDRIAAQLERSEKTNQQIAEAVSRIFKKG